MSGQGYIAFDLGAESGRAMLAILEKEKLTLHEAHRFANLPVRLPSGLHWNTTGLWSNLVAGLGKAVAEARQRNIKLVSLGVDTWGVDFGLVGKSGQLLGLPFAYRDARNAPAMTWAFEKVGEKAIYDATGIQFMALNSLYQLIAQHQAEPKLLAQTDRLLFMPDLLHYFFTGEATNEASIASTSQMIDPRTGEWATELLTKLGLPSHCLGKTVPSGAKIGKLLKHLAEDAGIDTIEVIAPGCHDTASAVAAVPVEQAAARTGNWAYLSSGTWSLMGAELDQPVVSDASREAGFTNERGVANKIRFLKNIAGLWLVQEVRRDFAKRGQTYDYGELTRLASQAMPFRTLVDPGHGPFASPGEMPAKIDAFAEKTGQPKPDSVGAYVRCCLESLALTYGRTLHDLEALLNRKIEVLHIVGGGGQNVLLNQMTADAIGRPVIVGPYEATAAGNALTQAIGAGHVRDLNHLRAIVRSSFNPDTYEPLEARQFEEHASRFEKLLGN